MSLTIVDTLVDRSQKTRITDGTNDIVLDNIGGVQAVPVSVKASVPEQATTATLTQVAASVTSIQLLAANPARKGVILFNDAAKIAYITFGATSSATAYTVKLPGGSVYEKDLPIYTGVISAIWAGADPHSMQITELT